MKAELVEVRAVAVLPDVPGPERTFMDLADAAMRHSRR